MKRVNENLVTTVDEAVGSTFECDCCIERVVSEMLSWERSLEMAHEKRIINSRLHSDSITTSSRRVHRTDKLVALKRLVLPGFQFKPFP